MSRWLRLFFGLLALFGPAAFPVEAAARPTIAAVGGSKADPFVAAARSPRVSAVSPEWQPPSTPSLTRVAVARPLYLLHRALLR